MTKVEYKANCVLCRQPVEIDGFILTGPEGVQRFCCAGCLSIYQLFHNSGAAAADNTSKEKKDTK